MKRGRRRVAPIVFHLLSLAFSLSLSFITPPSSQQFHVPAWPMWREITSRMVLEWLVVEVVVVGGEEAEELRSRR